MTNIDIMEHTGLIHYHLKLNSWLYDNTGYDYEDCYQEGFIALMQASKTYDPTKGAFSTHALNCINYMLYNAVVYNNNIVKLPANGVIDYKAIKGIIDQYKNMYGSSPSTSYISKLTSFGREKIEGLINAYSPYVSLDKPIKEGEDTITLLDTLEDEYNDYLVFEYKEDLKRLRKDLEEIFNQYLTNDMTIALKLFYGWENKPLNFNQVANRINKSSQDVKKLINKARTILKLRARSLAIDYGFLCVSTANNLQSTRGYDNLKMIAIKQLYLNMDNDKITIVDREYKVKLFLDYTIMCLDEQNNNRIIITSDDIKDYMYYDKKLILYLKDNRMYINA